MNIYVDNGSLVSSDYFPRVDQSVLAAVALVDKFQDDVITDSVDIPVAPEFVRV